MVEGRDGQAQGLQFVPGGLAFVDQALGGLVALRAQATGTAVLGTMGAVAVTVGGEAGVAFGHKRGRLLGITCKSRQYVVVLFMT